MKLTKKLMALALAMMMAFSCMAMPAMAADDDLDFPALYSVCGQCKIGMLVTQVDPIVRTVRNVGGCQKSNFTHQHTFYTQTVWDACSNEKCGYKTNPNVIISDEICNL